MKVTVEIATLPQPAYADKVIAFLQKLLERDDVYDHVLIQVDFGGWNNHPRLYVTGEREETNEELLRRTTRKRL